MAPQSARPDIAAGRAAHTTMIVATGNASAVIYRPDRLLLAQGNFPCDPLPLPRALQSGRATRVVTSFARSLACSTSIRTPAP